jgi:NADPH:quinone reductase-like Zn-dependent oxidoreductase
MEAGQLSPGQTVLIHGAAGGVGTFAVQIAKAHGAHVIGTSSDSNLEFLRALGADEVIDYNNARFEDVAHDVDVVLDTIGGETQDRSWTVLKPGGAMVTLVGFAPTAMETAQAKGVRAEMVAQRPEPETLRTLGQMIDDGRIKPVVSDVMPMSQVRQAQDRMQGGHVRGKIILHVDDE